MPLIIKFPHSYYKGKIIYKLARGIDILPTLLDVTKIDKIDSVLLEGISLMPIIQMVGNNQELYAISQIDSNQNPLPSAIRTDSWKMYGPKLFNLEEDPLEQKDMSGSDKKVRIELERRLNYLLDKNNYSIKTKKVDSDEATLNRLKSLGYID